MEIDLHRASLFRYSAKFYSMEINLKTTLIDYTLKTLFRQSSINLWIDFFILFNISWDSSQQDL